MAIKHDLRNYVEFLVQQEPAISEIYLFGSRVTGQEAFDRIAT